MTTNAYAVNVGPLTAAAKLRQLTGDPRHYQIAILAALLIYGLGALDFEITLARVTATMAAAILAQALCSAVWKARFDPRSALISGLSLCLLLRSNSLGWVLIAAVVTIASKFVLRFKGKHIFNPTNFGIVAMILLTGEVWVSPGQWGNFAFFGFLMACLGGLVVNRAARSDVALVFIGVYMTLVFGRSIYLFEPMTIPIHRLESGALLLFTFFMISDPKTTPNSRLGRILFGALVAWGAWYITFRMFRTNGLLWSLALSSIVVPIIDWLLPGDRYNWSRPDTGRSPNPVRQRPYEGGLSNESQTLGAHLVRSHGDRLVGPGTRRLLRLLRS